MRDARQRLVHCGTNALWWPFQAAAVGVQVGALVFMFYSVHVGVLLLEGGFCGGLCRCLSVAWALVSARDLAGLFHRCQFEFSWNFKGDPVQVNWALPWHIWHRCLAGVGLSVQEAGIC